MTKNLSNKFLSLVIAVLSSVILSGCGLNNKDKGSNKIINPIRETFEGTNSAEQSVNDIKNNTDVSDSELDKDLNTIESELDIDLSLDGLE